MFQYSRGSIWWTTLVDHPHSSVQSGYRPVVIVSSVAGCLSSDIVMVCPITTKRKDIQINVDIGPILENGPVCQVLTNQITTVPKSSLSKPMRWLTSDELERVETGILTSTGIYKLLDRIKLHQEALAQSDRDQKELKRLLPEAKKLITSLTELVNRADNSKVKSKTTKRVKRSKEEIKSFLDKWGDPSINKQEIMTAFGFNTYSAAYSFYQFHKGKELNRNG